MQNRRDQLHAYRFLTRRAMSAVITGDPDVAESPMRRISVTTIAGIMVAIVVAAGAFVIGLVKPGSTNAWKDPGTIIVERETGARYLLVNGKLTPTVNYSSAVLALGSTDPKTALVNRSTLAKVPRSPAIGILGLPDSLPAKSGLVTSGWTVCSQQQAPAKGRSQVLVSLAVGGAPVGAALSRDAGLYVRTVATGQDYLIWHGLRFQLTSPLVLSNLGLSGSTPLPVAGGFLNALTAGPDLDAPPLTGAGSAGPNVGGVATRIGQVLSSGQGRYYLVTSAAAIAPISKFAATVSATTARNGGGLDTHRVEDTAASKLATDRFDGARDLPTEMPALDQTSARAGGVCVDFGRDADAPTLSVPPAPSGGLGGQTVLYESARSQQGTADTVTVPPGRAAILRQRNAKATVFLVAGTGSKFPISPALLPEFGYDTSGEYTLTDNLILLVPTGPAMDPAAARSPPS